MTVRPQDLLRVARKYRGVTESPPGSNCNIFAPKARLRNCTYWCGAYTAAVLIESGVPVPPGVLTLSTRVNMQAWKNAGRWVAPKDVQPGDVLFFHVSDRNGRDPSIPSHTGFATATPAVGRQQSIDGNTSSSDHGSQDNGGGVYERERRIAGVVIGGGRPFWGAAEPPLPPPSQEEPMFYVIGWEGGPALWYFYPALGQKVDVPNQAALSEAMAGKGFGGFQKMTPEDVEAIPYLNPRKNG